MAPVCRVLSRFALAVVVVAIACLVLAGDLLSPSPLVIGAQLLAVAVAVWARRSFPRGTFGITAEPKGRTVIQAGPFRWVRHPQYASALLLIWAAVLSHLSVFSVAVGAVVLLVTAGRIACEERELRERLPGYDAYAARTRRLIPFVI